MTDDAPHGSAAHKAKAGTVQAVDRAMAILEALAEDEEGYRLTDLAALTGLSTSTVHRLLTTLERRRFVQIDQSSGLWHVGRQAFQVGATFARRRNFVPPALPFLRRLRDQTRETANLGVVDEGEIVVLTQVESREIMRAITRVGGRVPIAYSGMGKAILATYPPAEVAAQLAAAGRRPRRGATLAAELETIRRQGYAVDDEAHVPGLRCVAAVVYNDRAEPLCAISVSGLAGRLTAARLDGLGRLVRDTAKELTQVLGGTWPLPPA